MKQIESKAFSSLIYAVIFTLPVLIIFLCTSPNLSAAGDMNISEYLALAKTKEGFFFISPVLAAVLRSMNHIVSANWWAVFSVTVMFMGLAVFLWFIDKRNREHDICARLLLMVLFVLFFWEAILKYHINFTQTASIAGSAGILLILDCCYEEGADRKQICVKAVFAVIFLIMSGAIRWKALALLLPFALMCLGYMFIFPCSESIIVSLKGSVKNRKKILVMMIVVAITVFASNGIHYLYGVADAELREYVNANRLREDIYDYQQRYPAYEEASEIYGSLGIRQSWIDMVYTNLTGDLNYFSSDDLAKMSEMRQESKKTVAEFMDSLKGHAFLWICISLLIIYVMLLKGGKNIWLPLLGVCIAFVMCTLYFVYIGRFAWRVTNGCILACMISFIAMSGRGVTDVSVYSLDLSGWRKGLLMLTLLFCVGGYCR